MPFEYLQGQALSIALTLPRIAAAFLIIPLMTQETVPALVRNSFFVSLTISAQVLCISALPGAAAAAIG